MSLNKHEKREIRKKEKEGRKNLSVESSAKKIRNKKVIIYSIVALIGILIVYGIFSLPEKKISYTISAVHWHADLFIEICGDKKDMPMPINEHFLGSSLLHTHEDGRIHIEGQILNEKDITLGKYMDNIKVKFDKDNVFNYENGNMCNDGKENKVKMFVNNIENFEFRDHVIKNGDVIKIKYE